MDLNAPSSFLSIPTDECRREKCLRAASDLNAPSSFLSIPTLARLKETEAIAVKDLNAPSSFLSIPTSTIGAWASDPSRLSILMLLRASCLFQPNSYVRRCSVAGYILMLLRASCLFQLINSLGVIVQQFILMLLRASCLFQRLSSSWSSLP